MADLCQLWDMACIRGEPAEQQKIKWNKRIEKGRSSKTDEFCLKVITCHWLESDFKRC